MQGTQSSIIPDMTERHGRSPRQRVNEAVLAAMDEEEAGQGHPAWLRHWSREDQRPVATERGASGSAGLRSQQPVAPGTSSSPVNAYAGQSIEAAFSYETVFHFDTELEAESTDDWFELSSGQNGEDPGLSNGPEGREITESLLANESDRLAARAAGPPSAGSAEEARMLRRNGNVDDRSEDDRSEDDRREDRREEVLSAETPAPAIDPKAVRAAIFRLAQEPFKRWHADDRQAAAIEGTLPELGAEEPTKHEAEFPRSPLTAEADFADVARRVWITGSRIDGVPFPAAGDVGAIDEPVEVAQPIPAALAALQPEVLTPLAGDTQSVAAATTDVISFEVATAAPDGASVTAEMPHSDLTEQSERPAHANEEMVAGGAPALAHDASNLLSALKLYSELFALSGVLQARHSHYAEDLKLLAARSEVLIHRLLHSFTLAHDKEQSDKAQESLSQVEVSSADHRAPAEEDSLLHSGSSLRGALLREDRRPDPDVLSRVEGMSESGRSVSEESGVLRQSSPYWTEARLGTVHGPTATGTGEATGASVKSALHEISDSADRVASAIVSADAGGARTQPDAITAARLEEEATGDSDAAAPTGNTVGPVNFVDLLTRWGSLLSMIARSPVKVNFGANASLPVQISEEALERILVNLVHNAMEATREGGSIRIGVGRAETRRQTPLLSAAVDPLPADRMVLTVDDSGCGMTEQQVARILGIDASESLHRVSNEASPAATAQSSRRRGSGMGLQIVRELVASSGGELSIYSRRGAGTRIQIQWPILNQQREDERLPRRIPPASTAPISSNSKSQRSIQGPERNLEGAIAC